MKTKKPGILPSKITLGIHLEGIPIELARLDLDRYNPKQIQIMYTMHRYKRKAVIDFLVSLNPGMWLTPVDLKPIIESFYIQGTQRTKMTYQENVMYNTACFLPNDSKVEDSIDKHHGIYRRLIDADCSVE